MTTGVGLTVTLRLRMGAHDAHYAGELVDGARMLALFGDVATELLIRLAHTSLAGRFARPRRGIR